LKREKSIASKIVIYSIIFFYIPTILIWTIFFIVIRNEEIATNKKIAENSLTLFEKILHEKKEKLISTTSYITLNRQIYEYIKKREIENLSNYLEKLKFDHNLKELFIFDENLFRITGHTNNKEKYELSSSETPIERIDFLNNSILFENIVPLDTKPKKYFLYSSFTVNSSIIKSAFIANIDFLVINSKDNSVVFSTVNNLKITKSNFSEKESFYINYFNFNLMPKMKNYKIAIIMDPSLYRFKMDKIRYLILFMLFLWFFTTVIFFLLLNHNLVMPLKKILKGAEFIVNGKYDYKIRLDSKNELGLLANKFNEMSESLYKNNEFLKSINKELENKVIQRTKNLQVALDKLRDYDNQKTELFYSIVHDLKNPLTVIQGYASMVIQYDSFPIEKKKEFMKKIIAESDRLTKMLNDFLKTIKQEANLSKMEFSEIDIVPILEYFYSIYEVQAKEMMIDFVWDVQTPLPLIKGNKEKLEHVISNLLSNAFKFVSEKGMIKIIARVEDDFVKIGISDTGPGIEDGKEKVIFEKFKKLNTDQRNQSGAGLGLYIAQQIINKHNGNIWVQNNIGGKGCTFYFTLPIAKKSD